jgi:uncharacterized membrane protein
VAAVYDRWVRFEDCPEFVEGVEELRQLDERHLTWRMRIDGESRQFDAPGDGRVHPGRVEGDLRRFKAVMEAAAARVEPRPR